MKTVTIHQSGTGAGALRVNSHGGGTAYAFHFGEGDGPFRTLFFQGDDAIIIHDKFNALETAQPDKLTRDIWLAVLDPYL